MAKEKKHIKTDEELLVLFYTDKNNYWLGVLLERYTLLMLGVCLKYLKNIEDAKDAVQQVCTKIIADLQKHKVEHFKAWLLVVTRNYCLMQYRKKDEKKHLEFTDKLTVEDTPTNQQEQWLKDVTLDTIQESLTELNEAQRICIALFYLQEKSYKEIITSTGFDFKQVKTHIQNGKRNLKAIVMQKLTNQNK